jgi:hypothetical protein
MTYPGQLPKGREKYGPTHGLPDWAKVHDQYESDGKDETGVRMRLALMWRGPFEGERHLRDAG